MNPNKEFLSGTLNTIILALLKSNGKMYGYEICTMAREKTNGMIVLTEGAIYPALHKLEKKGVIKSSKELFNGRVRKYYTLQSVHASEIDDKINSLYNFSNLIQSLLKPSL